MSDDTANNVVTPSCPACGSVAFRLGATPDARVCTGGCGNTWHESDLSGERFAFLHETLHPSPPAAVTAQLEVQP